MGLVRPKWIYKKRLQSCDRNLTVFNSSAGYFASLILLSFSKSFPNDSSISARSAA